MTDLDHLRNRRGGRRLIIPGAIALVLGVIGIITYITLAMNETPGAASGQGALQGVLVVLSAALAGAGLLMLATGLIKHRRRSAGTERDDDQAATL
ncbi:MAG TPA: hypothetical protein VN200_01565 [Rhodoglobus sp.]|nr:hypothetical protein [Rhodoglobus sp.]